MDVSSLIGFLVPNARSWIEDQRNVHRSGGRSITSDEINSLQGYFRAKTLELARIKMVPQIENPPFYAELIRAGHPIPLDFRQMAGITFDNTILINKSYYAAQAFMPLLFHELVHVVQYGCLGVPEFATRYVMGWAQNGFNYASIPLERDAYDLQIKFQQSQNIRFSVENIIEEKLKNI